MGIQKNIKLRATVENIIYYQWKGIDCIRTVPAHVRQTKATRKAASDFGVAVKSSAVVRSMFGKLMPQQPAERSVIYKVDGAFRQWLKTNPLSNPEQMDEIPFFNGLSFNDEVNFQNRIGINIPINRTAERNLVLQWPELNPVKDIKAPKETAQVVVQYIAATIDMGKGAAHHSSATSFTIPYVDQAMPPQEMIFENVTGTQCVALVGMSIQYFKDSFQQTPINSMRRKPAGIVGSFYN